MKHLLVLFVLVGASSGTDAVALDSSPSRGSRTGELRVDKFLLLGEIDKLSRRGATPADIATFFPRLVRTDASTGERRVRYRRLTSLMLAEIERLAKRVQELEQLPRPQDPETEPLVRITVDRDGPPE